MSVKRAVMSGEELLLVCGEHQATFLDRIVISPHGTEESPSTGEDPYQRSLHLWRGNVMWALVQDVGNNSYYVFTIIPAPEGML